MKFALRAACLAALNALAAQAQAMPTLLTNGSFEAPWTSDAGSGTDGSVTFIYQPQGADVGWTFGASTGVAQEYSLLSAFDGDYFALLQTATQDLSQTFTLGTDSTVTLDFALALRTGPTQYVPGQQVSVSIDGQQVSLTPATSTNWETYSLNLGTLSAGQHTLSFRGTEGNIGDTTAYLDAVSLSAAPVPEPLSAMLALAGLGVLGMLARKR
jgi:PEP-CTERM motif